MAKPALGRGLGALLGGNSPRSAPLASANPIPSIIEPGSDSNDFGRVQQVPLAQVHSCPLQPRKNFAEETLRELADSIREQGIIQPLIVRPRREGGFELIAGERRWRAAALVGLSAVPVIVRDADDRAVLEMALIENLQRENLNPMEEAQGYARLIEEFQLRQEDAAAKVGRSRVAVANALRLLKLAPEVQGYLRNAQLSVGHAKVILGLETFDEHTLAAQRVLRDSLTVRQTEDLVASLQHRRGEKGRPVENRGPGMARDPHVVALENKLVERLGTKVSVRYRQGKGSLDIRFFSDVELERILQTLGVQID